MYLLGIDIGTSYWKAVLYDISGRVVAGSVLPAKVHRGAKFDYYEPGRLWQSVTLLIRKIVSQVKDPVSIGGIAVASMAESGVPLDKRGRALFPIIAWYDKCTMAQSEWWLENADRRKVRGITGLHAKHIYSVNKIMWLRENEPAVYGKMAKWLCIPGFIVHKLTGACSMDYSIASRTMLLDINKRKWSEEMIEHAKLDRNILPPLYPAGTAIGKLTKEAAEATGLDRKTVVVTGGHDHVCGAFAAGAVNEGTMVDSMGTAESMFCAVNAPVRSKNIYKAKFSSGCHVQPGKYYVMGGIYTSGAAVDWVAGLFSSGKKPVKEDKMNFYKKIINESSKLSSKEHDLFLVPYFRGSGPPDVDYNRRAMIFGLNLSVTKHDLVAAAIRGLCCESRKTMEALESCVNGKMRKVVVVGSLSGIKTWMRTKANTLGRDIEVMGVPEAGALGAAMLAGMGSGIFKSAGEVGENMRPKKTLIKYEPAETLKLNSYYKTYCTLLIK